MIELIILPVGIVLGLFFTIQLGKWMERKGFSIDSIMVVMLIMAILISIHTTMALYNQIDSIDRYDQPIELTIADKNSGIKLP